MKSNIHSKTVFSKYEDKISSAIMLMIVLVSLSIFATVAYQLAKLIL